MKDMPRIGDRIKTREAVTVEGCDISGVWFQVTNVLEYRTPGHCSVAVTARTDLGDEMFLLLSEFTVVRAVTP